MLRWLLLLMVIPFTLHAKTVAIRGTFFDFVDDPWKYSAAEEQTAARLVPDGLLVIEEGKIKDFGNYSDLSGQYADAEVTEYKDKIIIPGMIDCHIHYPQTRVIASYGDHLLGWLKTYIWPEEIKFKEIKYAREVAKLFFDDVLKNGTTTVQSFATTASTSVEAFFDEATKRNQSAICG